MVFAVIGGDLRQLRLAEALCRDGHEVRGFALGALASDSPVTRTRGVRDAAAGADCVVLPLPAEKNGLLFAPRDDEQHDMSAILAALGAERCALVFAGRVGEKLRESAEAAGLHLIDYFAREELQVMNAAATAEGAVMAALGSTGRTLFGARCLVVGFGRIGKLLAQRLDGMGAQVTVSARSAADKAWIRACGWRAEDTGSLDEALARYDIVFNTVPVRVLNPAGDARGSVYIELASEPGGADEAALKRAGFEYIPAPALPGRIAPVSSGEYIRDTIYNIMSEMGVDVYDGY